MEERKDFDNDVRLPVHEAKKVVVIGSGFAGLSSACCLAQDGFEVTILERHEQIGGRCRVWAKDGFTFDMGPSW
jgi:phytoene desaturase